MSEIRIEIESEKNFCTNCGDEFENHCRECEKCDDGDMYPVRSLPRFICQSCIEQLEVESGMTFDRQKIQLERWITVAEIKAGRR